MDRESIWILIIVSVVTLTWLMNHISETPTVPVKRVVAPYRPPIQVPKERVVSERVKPNFNKSVDLRLLPEFSSMYSSSANNKILQNAISNNPLREVLLNNDQARQISHQFNHRIKPTTKITDQKNSGRCWIFSFLNIFRYQLIKEHNLPEDFELSQNYLAFFDKLEKSYYFLEMIANTKNEPIDSRKIHWFISNSFSDGGSWNMLVNLINKYGVVPKHVMPETYQSGNTASLNMILEQNLRRMAYQIRDDPTINLPTYLNQQIFHIYRILVIFYGKPPTSFTWEYTPTNDSSESPDSEVVAVENLTPLTFSEQYLHFNSDDWVIVSNFPLPKYPFYRTFNVKYCNNMMDGMPTSLFNLPIEELRRLTKLNVDAGNPVWISVDWGKYYSCEYEGLDTKLYDFGNLGITHVNKGEGLEYHIAAPNHAVLIIGYNTNSSGEIDRWLVENSHGDEDCHVGKSHLAVRKSKGYVSMTDEWFKKYVYQMITHKKHLSHHQRDNLTLPPIEVEPWGTVGCELLKVYG